MIKSIIIIGLVVYGAGILKHADPASTVTAFETLNGAVQSVAVAAAPHVAAVASGVLQPAINQVKNGAEVTQNFQIHDPRVERDIHADAAIAQIAVKNVLSKVDNGCAWSGDSGENCSKWH